MKKLYSLLFALLTFAGMTNAQVVFDIAANPWGLTLGTGEDAEAGNVSSITQDGVVINLSLNAESGTPPRMWTGPQLRIYGNNVIEIVADKDIKSVTFTFTLYNSKDADGNTINYLVGPQGEQVVSKAACATSGKTVTFTTAHTKGNIRITKIEVGLDGDTPGPGPDPQTIDWTSSATAPLTVAQALEKAAQLEGGADSGKDVYVKGKISQIDEVSPKLEDGSGYGNATYYISDDGTTTNQFYVYRGKSLKGADFTSEDEIKVGDEVIVVGLIKNYVKDENSTLEFNQGNFLYSLNGDTGGVDPQPGESKTIAQVIAGGAAAGVVTTGTVYASCPNGVIIGDGTGYIYAYRPSESAEVGDVVKITGNVSQYGGCFQFGQGCTLEKTGTASVTYPAVKEIDGAAFDALVEAPAVTYVKVAGTLKISGNYKNLEIAGATNMGSLQVSDAVLGSAGDGDAVEVTGFFAYKSGSSTIYGNILATEVKVTGDTPDPEAPEYTTIAAVKEAVTADRVNVVFKANNLLVTYVNGKNVYVFDGTDGLLLFANDASLNEGIKAGDKITADFKGQLYLYNGRTEIATSAIENLTVNSSDNAVEAQKVTIADVNNNPKDYENELVEIEGLYAQAEALASRNITFMDDSDNEVVVRDNWNVLTSVAFNTESEYTVTGFVAIFAKDGSTTTQIYPRTAEDVSNGETPQPYELAGEGTLEKPYTVADVQYLINQEDCPKDPVWVKGFIMGAAKSTMNNIIKEQGDDLQVSNIVLADDAAEAASANMIPVQLASTNEVTKNVRANLNLVDNFENLGKEVWVFGTIEKYFSVPGVKNTSDYSFEGQSTGVNAIKADAENANIYTIAGQRVNAVGKGLYIVGNKKVLAE